MLCQHCLARDARVHLLLATPTVPATIEFFRYDYCTDCASDLRISEQGPPRRTRTDEDLEQRLRIVEERDETITVEVLSPDGVSSEVQRRDVIKEWIPKELRNRGLEFTVVIGRDAINGFYVDTAASDG
jgi:hypothetical protein